MNPTMPDDGLADTEQQFRDGLAEVVRRRPPLEPIDVHSVRHEANAPRRRSRRSVVWLAVAAVTVIVLGVALAANLGGGSQRIDAGPASSPSSATPLVGTVWQLASIGSAPVEESVGRAYVVFDELGHVTGSTGCLTFGAAYTLERERLTFADVKVVGCPETSANAQQAGRVLQAVGQVREFAVTDDRLRLLDGSSALLLGFTAVGRPTAVSPTRAASLPTQAQIRVRNDSSVVLTDVVMRHDGYPWVDYGTVLPGQTTLYRAAGELASRHDDVYATVGGRRIGPPAAVDYTKQAPLGPGTYTYVLTVDHLSQLNIEFRVDR